MANQAMALVQKKLVSGAGRYEIEPLIPAAILQQHTATVVRHEGVSRLF